MNSFCQLNVSFTQTENIACNTTINNFKAVYTSGEIMIGPTKIEEAGRNEPKLLKY